MKGIVWDKAREIYGRLAGTKPEIDEWKRTFQEDRVYEARFEDMENEPVREIIKTLTKEARDEGRFEEMYFKFKETLDDGSVRQYYEQEGKATAGELAQLTREEFRKGHAQMRKAFGIHNRAKAKYGREYTRLLKGVCIPERPPELEMVES